MAKYDYDTVGDTVAALVTLADAAKRLSAALNKHCSNSISDPATHAFIHRIAVVVSELSNGLASARTMLPAAMRVPG